MKSPIDGLLGICNKIAEVAYQYWPFAIIGVALIVCFVFFKLIMSAFTGG